MNRLEFSTRLIKLLGDDELRDVLKKATTKGFSVQGFKNPWKAPISTVAGCMKQKDKDGKYYYILLLDIISELDIRKNENSNSAVKIVKKWINNGKILNEQIENDLIILEEENKACKISKENEICVCTDNQFNNFNETELVKKNESLKEKNKLLQEKNKKLQLIVQSNKIEISDLKQIINKLQAEDKKLKKEVSKAVQDANQFLKDKNDLIKKNKEEKDYNLALINQIDELKKYKECAPKIICFLKAKIEKEEFKGYDITFVKEWDDSYKEDVANNIYDEIWIIHKGFSYNDITEIKAYASCQIKEYLNISQLRNELEEKNEYNR